MVKTVEGNLDASKLSVGIVVSRFNELVSNGLLTGAVDCLKRHLEPTLKPGILPSWACL